MANGLDQLVTITHPRSPVAEAYRALRTSILFSSLDSPVRSLLVTSTAAEEGKSTTLANLGVTFAQAGHEVILVDSDLRRPSLHRLFDLPNEYGLTTALLSETAGPVLQPTPVERLRVLTSGPLPPNPAELLSSRRCARLIAELRDRAEFVFFDCPPIVAVTDAAILARQVDGVVLVVSAGRTRWEHAARARQLLERVQARVLGVVLTNVTVDASLYQYYE